MSNENEPVVEVPHVAPYPEYVGDAPDCGRRWDLAVAVAAHALDEPAESGFVRHAARHLFHDKSLPTCVSVGRLPAEHFARLSERLDVELTASESEHERLKANADAVRRSRIELDAEGDTLRRIAELRVAVMDRKRTAEQADDVEALRRALAQAFDALYLGLDGRILGYEQRGVRPGSPDADRQQSAAGVPLTSRAGRVPPRRTTQHGTFVSKYMTQKTRRPL